MSATPVPGVVIRRAAPGDIDVIARQRAAMFHDMGSLPRDLVPMLVRDVREALGPLMDRHEYAGWLAVRGADAVAGAGVHLRRILPRPSHVGEPAVVPGRQGLVVNVYTEPEWRRRGLAEALMRHIIEFARAESLDSLVLHAAEDGRRLYEKLGFVQTNEMRFNHPL